MGTKGLVLGILELIIAALSLSLFSLSISLQSHLTLFVKAFTGTFDFLTVLAANFVNLLAMLLLQSNLLVLLLIAEEFVLEEAYLRVDVTRLLKQLVVYLSDTLSFLHELLSVSGFQRRQVGPVQVFLLFLVLFHLSFHIIFLYVHGFLTVAVLFVPLAINHLT